MSSLRSRRAPLSAEKNESPSKRKAAGSTRSNKKKKAESVENVSSEEEFSSGEEEERPKMARSMTDTIIERKPAEKKEWNRNAKSLEQLDYKFSDEGKLVHAKTGEGFKFVDQEHYEMLGDFVVTEVQNRMKTECGLEEIWLPIDAKTGPRVNIFMTKDALTNPDKLLLVICGTGAVRAGQWARALCINDSLETGSMIPYFKRALKENYGIIVLNPNFTHVRVKKKGDTDKIEYEEVPIEGLDTKFKHVNYVWDNYVKKSKAKLLAIVAHSFGGVLSTSLLHDREEDIFGDDEVPKRLRAIAFTDSVHSLNKNWSKRIKAFLKKDAINWVRSKLPVDTKINQRAGCGCRSAGTESHELSSSSCMEALWSFLDKKVK